MDRVCPGRPRRFDDEIVAQVGVRRRVSGQPHRVVRLPYEGQPRVGVGVDGDGLDAEPPAGREDAARDLAPVRDEESAYR